MNYKLLDGILIFYLGEKVEIYAADEIKNFIAKTIAKTNAKKVIINFQKVDYLDSSGIGMLLNLKFSFKNEIQLRFCQIRDAVFKVFKYTCLDKVFLIDDTEEQSVVHISARDGAAF